MSETTGRAAPEALPHAEVYVRLGMSAIHGIGVLAIRPIPRGTDIFANDRVELVWVAKADLDADGLLPAQWRLYHDFGIVHGAWIGCPVNFHNLTPGWYCNEPADGELANVRVEGEFAFIAARDIAEGEEVTVRYAELTEAAARAFPGNPG